MDKVKSNKLLEIVDEETQDEILKHFDFNYKYGPMAGLSRKQRWTNAFKLNLNPPQEIFDILEQRESENTGNQKEEMTHLNSKYWFM